MAIKGWMSWEGGVDLVAATQPGLAMPNVIVHVGRLVHTPAGSAPSGLVFYQPDPAAPPQVMGFISQNPDVGRYFGPCIFAGTPFENAPVLPAKIEVWTELPQAVGAKVTLDGLVLETRLSALGPLGLINRAPAAMPPFAQQGLEAPARVAELKVNGKAVSLLLPAVGISGGPPAVWAPSGVYAR